MRLKQFLNIVSIVISLINHVYSECAIEEKKKNGIKYKPKSVNQSAREIYSTFGARFSYGPLMYVWVSKFVG